MKSRLKVLLVVYCEVLPKKLKIVQIHSSKIVFDDRFFLDFISVFLEFIRVFIGIATY